MTRESDDTSLGAELLDEIYSGDETQPNRKGIPGGTGTGTGVGRDNVKEETYEEVGEPAVPMQRMMVLEVVDPLAGMFNGLLVAALILLGISGMVATTLIAGSVPGFVDWLASNMLIWLIVAVVIVGASMGVGFLLGKKSVG